MAHWSEHSSSLKIIQPSIGSVEHVYSHTSNFTDVCLVFLPLVQKYSQYKRSLNNISTISKKLIESLELGSTCVIIGEPIDLVQVQLNIPSDTRFQCWIAIERSEPLHFHEYALPSNHFGALVLTKYPESLKHTKTRIQYTYCPCCEKTTKDYGGKKHTYHEYGTLMSDVWSDFKFPISNQELIDRFRDLFGIDQYKNLLVIDLKNIDLHRSYPDYPDLLEINGAFNGYLGNNIAGDGSKHIKLEQSNYLELSKSEAPTEKLQSIPSDLINQILHGDCVEWLKKIPDNSVDYIFTDPPYNLGKSYFGYEDDLEIQEYFYWCDAWLYELSRILKPNRTLSILNIPLWAVRHFSFLHQVLEFQNWIAWDALAYPVRKIMPAHYTILSFSKGNPRPLPALSTNSSHIDSDSIPGYYDPLRPLAKDFCLRASCIRKRKKGNFDDREDLTDLWGDIHRLKHNSRRVDHPTLLPPHLLQRLISIYSFENELVLDCFNGAGTTTLVAHMLNRKFIGIEISRKYIDISRDRHEEILKGIDPFRKLKRSLNAKNSPVPRMPKIDYVVPKKTLQLDVRRVANHIGHIPSREELIEYSKYPIKYYDEYFVSWGEVCAAARTTGMSEDKPKPTPHESDNESQLKLGL